MQYDSDRQPMTMLLPAHVGGSGDGGGAEAHATQNFQERNSAAGDVSLTTEAGTKKAAESSKVGGYQSLGRPGWRKSTHWGVFILIIVIILVAIIVLWTVGSLSTMQWVTTALLIVIGIIGGVQIGLGIPTTSGFRLIKDD